MGFANGELVRARQFPITAVREILIMSKVDHINVLRLKEVCYTEGMRLPPCMGV